ncbi:MAG: YlmC/YmxH family sporulation protein, partial [Clostridia bacterium]|nr:YlmC/YmxH family sporulation protein [Clostridia bacterium]
MRWSELAGKEIINLHDGARLGRLGEADLLLDPETGTIESLLVSAGGGWFGLLGRG